MVTRKIATVFGGTGFIGRYVVRRLAADGSTVRVVGRDPQAAMALRPMGDVGQIVPLYGSLAEPASLARALEGADLAVNLIGILAERRRGDFDRIQHRGAGAIATAAAAAGVTRLAHLSAIGADAASPSRYASSKAHGEAAVHAAFPTATILRPSVVFGPEDAFFNRFAGMARVFPFMPVVCGATRLQPVYVGDVAASVHAVLTGASPAAPIFELGGPETPSMRELLQYILTLTEHKRPLLTVPYPVARLQAAVLQYLPGPPLTPDQLLLLRRDNVVSGACPGLAALGITPTPFALIVPGYLKRFRPGGG